MTGRVPEHASAEELLHAIRVSKVPKVQPFAPPGPKALRLQRTIGNRATERLIHAKLRISQPQDAEEQEAERVAEDASPPLVARSELRTGSAATIQEVPAQGPSFGPRRLWSPFEEALQPVYPFEEIKRKQRMVAKWLTDNKSTLYFLTMGQLVSRVRREGPQEASTLIRLEIEEVIEDWAKREGINISVVPFPGRPLETPEVDVLERLVEMIEDGLSSIPGELSVEIRGALVKIDLGGSTIDLPIEGMKLQGGLDWDGTAKIKASVGDFVFEGSVSEEKYEVSLSYVIGSKVPDVAKLREVVLNGKEGIERIVELLTDPEFEHGDIETLIESLSDEISPEKDKIKKALKELKRIEDASSERFALRIRAGVTGPGPEAESEPSPAPDVVSFGLSVSF